MRWIGTEVCELPHFDGLTDVTTFFIEFEVIVVEKQRLLALDISMKATLARWWATHKTHIQEWSQCKRLMQIRFGEKSEYIVDKYTRLTIPKDHIVTSSYVWNDLPKEAWTHMFIHTLDTIP